MDKAILIIDMPKNCYECSLNNCHFCDVTADCIEEYTNTEYRPNWCPLRPMPEKYEIDKSKCCDPFYEFEFEYGYNQCIDEILDKKAEV